MLITFSGLDGSGKTTLIRELASSLRREGRRVRVLTMYDDVTVYSYLRRLRDRVVGRPRPAAEGTARQSGPVAAAYAIVRSPRLKRAIFIADLIALLARRAFHEALRGEILILDRYLYDSLVEIAAPPSLPPVALLEAITPHPDIPILVDVVPETAYARKGEYDVPSLAERRRRYLRMFASIPTALVVRNDDVAAASAEIAREVAKRMRP